MNTHTVSLTWKEVLAAEKEKPYFQKILDYIKSERQKGKKIYPAQTDIFNALKYTPFEKVKILILGQDPYHGPNQAHGLAFSVKPHVAIPPSLQNIYQELHDDLGIPVPQHGCLIKWAEQGVLLLNAVLSVEAHKPQSHAHIGWQQFTDAVIASLNQYHDSMIFILWGSYAQRQEKNIDTHKHHILKAPHPSPLSAHRGFLGCKHFSAANKILLTHGQEPIDWQIT